MQSIENKITTRFKIYDHIVCLNDGFLYQLQHCPKKRTKSFRKLRYNEKSNGGSTPNYSEDELWSKLKEKLTDREMLLKVAMKSNDTIYDSDGCEVPRVSENIRKSSLSISY